ncbi:MAG TPA: hypothetical protein ENK13_02445 [Thermopetrobacter sp.]|nr:hypothetical protein [Thermopetrobacter sp.]
MNEDAAGREERDAASGTDRRWTALVLAAGRGPDDPMARAFGVRHKCLLEVGGRPMLTRVVEALLASPRIAGIAVVIDDADAAGRALADLPPAALRRVRILPAADSAAASVLAAVERHGLALPLLVTTADHALLDAAMLEHFLATASRSPADLVLALARRETVEAAFPHMRRTWMPLGGEAVTSCNLFALLRPPALRAVAFWRSAEKDRKRPWRIALRFGLSALLRMLLSRRGTRHVVAMAGRRLGLRADVVFMPMATAALDVDRPQDLELARDILASRETTEKEKRENP